MPVITRSIWLVTIRRIGINRSVEESSKLVESRAKNPRLMRNPHSVRSTPDHFVSQLGEPSMAINTTTRLGTPLSTKLIVGLGLLLTAVGGGLAIADHLRSTAAETSAAGPAATAGFAVPSSGHLLQFVGLLVAFVCVAGFLVVSRNATQRR
jgi:hypothetical protein